MLTFVEDPLSMQKTIEIPKNHLDVCETGNVPTVGNAAANKDNFLDLTGQPSPPNPLPEG
jgi:iron transport multicopper oxidase